MSKLVEMPLIGDVSIITELSSTERKICRKAQHVLNLVTAIIRVKKVYILKSYFNTDNVDAHVAKMEFLVDLERRRDQSTVSIIVKCSTTDIPTPASEIAMEVINVLSKNIIAYETEKTPVYQR